MPTFKCESCGALKQIDSADKYAVCEYCGMVIMLDSSELDAVADPNALVLSIPSCGSTVFQKKIFKIYRTYATLTDISTGAIDVRINFSLVSSISSHGPNLLFKMNDGSKIIIKCLNNNKLFAAQQALSVAQATTSAPAQVQQPITFKMGKNPKSKIAVIVVCSIIAAIAIIFVIGALNSPHTEYPIENEQSPNEYISLEEYDSIQNGMTYDQVVKIVGCEGKVVTSSSINDVEGITYQWPSKTSGGIITYTYGANITFINGEVSAKIQIGLGLVED